MKIICRLAMLLVAISVLLTVGALPALAGGSGGGGATNFGTSSHTTYTPSGQQSGHVNCHEHNFLPCIKERSEVVQESKGVEPVSTPFL